MEKKRDATRNTAMKKFEKTITDHYVKYRRSFPWREEVTPYRVVISEIMLQQTQALRVVPKFESFMRKFPDFETLAQAPLRDVLAEWQGLGYNRRGLQLKKLAETVVSNGVKHGQENGLPRTKESLMELPGIGPNTAGSVLAFAFNIPQAFIETNIRSVFIHFFFKNSRRKVHDKDILKLVETSLAGKNNKNAKNPREWYYALMDYGVHLKNTLPNPSRKSQHHVRQSPFKGSNRELRANILKSIVAGAKTKEEIIALHIQPHQKLGQKLGQDDILILKNLADLVKEGFIVEKDGRFHII